MKILIFLMMLVFVLICFTSNLAYGYDVVLTGLNSYDTPVNYAGQNILVDSNGFVVYGGDVTFDNCILDIDGAVELIADVNMINSVINVKGSFEVAPGVNISETGASSIIATGDFLKTGKITIEGRLDNHINIYSDYIQNDIDFIIFDPNSSLNSTVKCADFYGGLCNLLFKNIRLNEPISNCRFFGAAYAIWQDGKDHLTDVEFSLFYNNYMSLYFGIKPTSSSEEVKVTVDNVIIDNNYAGDSWGCVVVGSTNSSYFGLFQMTNSIITKNYCGWYVDASTYVGLDFTNVAYYDNYYDDNLIDSSPWQSNPMYLSQSPFAVSDGPSDWPYFLDPNGPCASVDLGYDMWQNSPQQLLTTIFLDSTSRGNVGMGFGMSLEPNYVTPIEYSKSDFNVDGVVNLADYSIFESDWLTTKDLLINPVNHPDANGFSIADSDKDGFVDMNDLQYLCGEWLHTSNTIGLSVQEDTDYFIVDSEPVLGLNVMDYAYFLGGKYVATRQVEDNSLLKIEKVRQQNGNHELVAVVKGPNNVPYVTNVQTLLFDSSLSGLEFEQTFDSDKCYPIKGNVESGHTVTIAITDFDDQTIWSDDFSDDFIAFVEPSDFAEGVNFYVTHNVQLTGQAMTLEELPILAATSSSDGSSILGLGGKPTAKTAALGICMIEEGMKRGSYEFDTGTVRWFGKMMKSKGITPIILCGYGTNNQVNLEMFQKVFDKYRNIRYMHILAHSNYECDGAGFFGINVPRTLYAFNDGIWPVTNSRIWTDRGIATPNDYVWLSKDLEKANHLGLFPFRPGQLIIFCAESCYTLRNTATINSSYVIDYVDGAYEDERDDNLNFNYDYPYSDICFAFNMYGEKQVAIGSAELVIEGAIYTSWSRFFNTFWKNLKEGDNAHTSLNEAMNTVSFDLIQGLRLRGLGAGNLNTIYLRVNP